MKTSPIKTAALTDKGLVREDNEDFFSADDQLSLYIVADGMGGHRAGEVASRIAVEIINKNYWNYCIKQPGEIDFIIKFAFTSLIPSICVTLARIIENNSMFRAKAVQTMLGLLVNIDICEISEYSCN